jgi:hypothetical protein
MKNPHSGGFWDGQMQSLGRLLTMGIDVQADTAHDDSEQAKCNKRFIGHFQAPLRHEDQLQH